MMARDKPEDGHSVLVPVKQSPPARAGQSMPEGDLLTRSVIGTAAYGLTLNCSGKVFVSTAVKHSRVGLYRTLQPK